MDMKKLAAIGVICLCAAFVTGFALGGPDTQRQTAAAAKGKPTPGPGPTEMFFSDRPGDKIMNDIYGPYVDGVGGVVCRVVQDPGTDCTFLLNIQTVSRPKRYVSYDYRTIAGTDCDPDGGNTGIVNDKNFIIVQHVGDAPIGVPVARHANFFTSVGHFHFMRPQNPSYQCSTTVLVERIDAQHWSVRADETMLGLWLPTNDGLLAPVGPIAQLNDLPGAFWGNYTMPFEMNIYCPGCK